MDSWNEAFPSRYLRAEDLKGRPITVTIERIEYEEMQNQDGVRTNPVIYFAGATKGMVVNKTKAGILAFAFGDNPNDCIGQQIVLTPGTTFVRGQKRSMIEVTIPPRRAVGYAPQSKPNVTSGRSVQQYDERNPPPQDDMDDEIPF